MKRSFNLAHIVVTPIDVAHSMEMQLPIGTLHFGTITWLGRNEIRRTWLELLRLEYTGVSQPEYQWYVVMILTGQQFDDNRMIPQNATKGPQLLYTDLSKWNKETIEELRESKRQQLSHHNENSNFNSLAFQCQWDYIQLMFFTFAAMPECYRYYDVVNSMEDRWRTRWKTFRCFIADSRANTFHSEYGKTNV